MNRPSFEGGLHTLCSVRSFVSLVEMEGGILDQTSFYNLITSSTSPYPEMIGFISDRINKLDSTNLQVAKIQSIFTGLMSRNRTPELLWTSLVDLNKWIDQYKTKKIAPISQSLEFFMRNSPLVFVEEYSSNLPGNAFPLAQIEELTILFQIVTAYTKMDDNLPYFKARVYNELSFILATDEGRKLLGKIFSLTLGNGITINPGNTYNASQTAPKIQLGNRSNTCIYECPDRENPNKTILKSLRKPQILSLAHELIHIFHGLDGLDKDSYPKGSERERVYTNSEEERTIRGSADSPISENSIGLIFNLYPRYGHRCGNKSQDPSAIKLERAISLGIEGDIPQILQSAMPSTLCSIYQTGLAKLKSEQTLDAFKATRKKLKRSLAIKVEESPTKKPRQPRLRLSPLTLSAQSSKDLKDGNRVKVLKTIQSHLLRSNFDPAKLLPP